MAELGRIYLRLIGARVRSQLEYRTSLALQIFASALLTTLDFVMILVLFENVPELDGWTVQQVALLYGIAGIAFALSDLIVGHLDLFPQMIRDGTFDQILVRPLPSLLQVVASDFSLRRLGKMLQAVVVLIVALVAADIDWTVGRAVMVPLAVAGGVLIYTGVWVALATIAFWIVDAIEFVNAFTYGGNFLSAYPITIFGRWLQNLVVFLIPIAFVAYMPALYILDKPDELGLPEALQYVSPFVAVLTVLVARLVWENAVRHYRSAGG